MISGLHLMLYVSPTPSNDLGTKGNVWKGTIYFESFSSVWMTRTVSSSMKYVAFILVQNPREVAAFVCGCNLACLVLSLASGRDGSFEGHNACLSL